MGYRYLTDGELALATSIYGDGIDYSSIKIYDRAAGIFGVGVSFDSGSVPFFLGRRGYGKVRLSGLFLRFG